MKYIIKQEGSNFVMTTEENERAYISNARNVWRFYKHEGFTSIEDVMDYVEKYFNIARENIIVK